MTRSAVSRVLIPVFVCLTFAAGIASAADLVAPSSLAATAASSSQINLSWVNGNNGETGISVERSLSASSGFVVVGTAARNSVGYVDTGLSAGTTYYYRVRATGRKGTVSPYSNVAGATTGVVTPTPAPTPSPTPAPTPAAPSALSAVAASSSQINLSWSDNSSNETGFKVERASSSSGPWGQIGTTAGTSYANTGLSSSTTYWYRVRAYNGSGDSSYSNTASATTSASATAPTAPGNLIATAASTSQINLTWLDNSTNETGFKVERASSSTGPWTQIATPGAGAVSYPDASGLTASTPYWYRVRAYNAVGDSAYSNTATATTLAAASGSGSQVWAQRFSGTGAFDNAYASSVAIDSQGSAIVAGSFQRTVDFGGGSLVSAGGSDVFVVKYSSTGQHLWSRSYGGIYDDVAQGVAVDSNGNAIVTGYFSGSASFGGASFTAVGQTDIFLAKYSSAGAHVWSYRFGGFNPDRGYSVAADANGNVFVTGYMVGTVDFGGGPMTSYGGADIFLAKFTSAGGHLWSRHYGGTSSEVAQSLALDSSANVAVAGYFQGSANFGGAALNSAGGNDAFLARYDANGNPLWSRGWGGSLEEQANAVAVDSQGSVITTGTFSSGSVGFGGAAIANTGGPDIFLVKLDASGSHVWSKGYGTTNTVGDSATALAVDGSDNILLTGSMVGGVDFGGGPLNGNGSYDVFIAKFRSDSSHLWSKRCGALYDDHGWGIAADSQGNVVTTGDYYVSVDFGGGALVNEAGTDSFLVKLTP